MKIEIAEFLKQTSPVIDVRSPAEFLKGHFPGAYNIPLLSNEERAVIGTLYKQKGREEAILKALELTGPKMAKYVYELNEILENYSERKIRIYCWRGGMRSGSMAWLFSLFGVDTDILIKGYKAYRNFVQNEFSKIKKPIILGGYTGSGKTEILHQITGKNQQVVDLEYYAHHKGSAFGFIGEKAQPSTEQFENNIGILLNEFDKSLPIWIEDESRTIGKVYLPENLYATIRNSDLIFIDLPKELRVENLVRIYAGYEKSHLLKALDKIVKRLGGQNYKAAVQALEVGDYHTVADISLSYYDKAYLFGMNKRDKNKVHKLVLNSNDSAENAEAIMEFYVKKKL
ncbi:MAG: tRNA 2-selenouridine(34) synthase MnmH [Saprospiraceae bacterium]